MSEPALTGFPRADGRVGFRNRVMVIPLTGCQVEIARRIAAGVPGATCLGNVNGCDLQGGDFALLGTLLEHFATHPNVGAVLFLAMGCAATLPLNLQRKARESGRLAETLNTQAAGTTATVAAGIRIARGMAQELDAAARVPVPFGGLVVGTKCGASDPRSFSHCHPVVGRACDLLVARGATVVLAEDCELVASAPLLAGRAADAAVAEKIRALPGLVNGGWKARFGYTLEDLALKGQAREQWVARALAHAAKAGTTPFRGFFEMEERVTGPGLVILNGPNTDLESVTALAAAGCNVTVFTTGRGTPVGSPASITLKVTATRATAEKMAENIDLCVASVEEGTASLEEAAQDVFAAVVRTANGEETAAERLGHWEVAMPIRGVTY